MEALAVLRERPHTLEQKQDPLQHLFELKRGQVPEVHLWADLIVCPNETSVLVGGTVGAGNQHVLDTIELYISPQMRATVAETGGVMNYTQLFIGSVTTNCTQQGIIICTGLADKMFEALK